MSKATNIIASALIQVEQLIAKSEGVLNTLQQQINQVNSQRIGLNANKTMLTELMKAIENAEEEEAKVLPTAESATPTESLPKVTFKKAD